MQTEIIKCPLCSSQKYQRVYIFDSYSILACQKCDLRRRSLRLSMDEREKLYSKKYFVKEQKEYFAPCLKDVTSDDFRIQDFSNRLDQLQLLIEGKSKRLLDIGCATGTFLELAEKKGLKAEGIDISDFAIDLAKKKGLKAKATSVENFSLPRHRFDTITAWEVVPNLENINLAFEKIKKMLKPNGVLAIQLTVTDSLLFDLSDLIYKLSFGKATFLVKNGHPINHTCHFSRKTLKKFVGKHGFKIIKSENVEFNFHYSKMPKILLPFLDVIGIIAKKIGRTTQNRIFLKKK